MRARLRSHIQVRADIIDLQLWIRVAFSHLWIFVGHDHFHSRGCNIGRSVSFSEVRRDLQRGRSNVLVDGTHSPGSQCLRVAPKFAELHVQKRQADLQNLFTAVVRITLWPSLAIAAGLIALGTPLLLLSAQTLIKGTPY